MMSTLDVPATCPACGARDVAVIRYGEPVDAEATVRQFAPTPVISPLLLVAFPAVLILANAVAAFPAHAAAHTQPATVLRAE